jgi:hypothetical protein
MALARSPCVARACATGSSLFVGDSAALCPALEESRSVDPDPLPQRRFDRQFEEALIALLEKDAGGLSASWSEEHRALEQALLVIIGATPESKKELVGLIDGVLESGQSWRELLLDLKHRGLTIAP